MDPRELQRRKEFFGKRFLGETEEYTEAKETKETVMKHRIIRRHSFDTIESDQKQYILARATFATRYHDNVDSDASSDVDLSSSSSSNSLALDHKTNVVYRVSFADPERVEAVQALLSKNKKSIIVHQRSNQEEFANEKIEACANSAIKIYNTSTSDEKKLGESSETKHYNSRLEDSSIVADSSKQLTGKSLLEFNKTESGPTLADSTSRIHESYIDKRCSTDEKQSLEIRIQSQTTPVVQVGPQDDDHTLSLAPICNLL